MPVRVQNTETVVKTESSSLTSLNLGGLGAMERLYTLLVTSVGLAIFLLAMIAERQREFGAMRALGANLSQLRRFLLAEAATIGSLSIVIGFAVGVGLAQLLVMLLGVIFTIPARELAFPGLELVASGCAGGSRDERQRLDQRTAPGPVAGSRGAARTVGYNRPLDTGYGLTGSTRTCVYCWSKTNTGSQPM